MGPFNPELIQQVVARELAKPKPAFVQKIDYSVPTSMPVSPIKPETMASIGGIADMLGTYAGLKHPVNGATEANPLYAGNSPSSTVLMLGGQLLAQKGLTNLLRHMNHPKIADAIAANQGARQLGLGSVWGSIQNGQSSPMTGNDTYTIALSRGLKQYGR